MRRVLLAFFLHRVILSLSCMMMMMTRGSHSSLERWAISIYNGYCEQIEMIRVQYTFRGTFGFKGFVFHIVRWQTHPFQSRFYLPLFRQCLHTLEAHFLKGNHIYHYVEITYLS